VKGGVRRFLDDKAGLRVVGREYLAGNYGLRRLEVLRP